MRRHLRVEASPPGSDQPAASEEPVLPSSIMPSELTLRMLLAAVTLAALQLSASGAPLEEARTDEPAGVEGSGEEKQEGEETFHLPESLNVFDTWEEVIALTKCHKQKFEGEFQGNVKYHFLDMYKQPSFPVKCSNSNFSKEAYLQTLAQDLLTYTVLLKHVKKEYPNCPMVTKVTAGVLRLMKQSEQVEPQISNQEQKLLKELDDPDLYTRRMTAYKILSSLCDFLVDCIRSFRSWETPKKQAARTTPINCEP